MTPEHMKTTPEDIDLDRMKDDTISRQAVLKLLSTIPAEEAITKAMLIQSVKQMDAAQPSGPDNLVKDSQGLAKDLVNDCISRKAALDALEKSKEIYFDRQVIIGAMKGIVRSLPSAQPKSYREGYQAGFKDAQPERKRGKWIDYTDEGYVECPFCHSATNCDGNEDELHFCFSCGADMREDDHEAR